MIEQRDVKTASPAASNGGLRAVGGETLGPGAEMKAPGSSLRRRILGLLWLLVFVGLGYFGYRYYQASQKKAAAAQVAQAARLAGRAVSVSATAVRRGDVPILLRGLGNVIAFNTVNVKARVDGPIVQVNFREGQFVTKDEVLLEIDPRPYQVVLEQAQGNLARDEAQLRDAQVNLERYRKLWDDQVIPKQQFDTQAAQVGQFQGAIEVDKAAIDSAELNLSFTKVAAPIAGRIGLRQVDIGNIVHATDPGPLAIITQMQPIAVLFTIPADDLPPVLAKLRADVKLRVDAYDRADRAKVASGILETVDNQIDPTTGTSRLKAIFDNQDNALFPNQFVNCRLMLDTMRGVVIIPAAAVERGPQGAYVYVVKPDHTVAMRPITIGTTEGNEVEAASGLAPGETVVTDGQDKLQEGTKVDIRPAAGTPAADTEAPAPGTQPTSGGGRRGRRP